MPLGQHFVCIVHGQLVLSFQMNGSILLVGKPFLAHRAFKSILYATLESHVPVQIVVPVVALSALLALERLFVCWSGFSLSRV